MSNASIQNQHLGIKYRNILDDELEKYMPDNSSVKFHNLKSSEARYNNELHRVELVIPNPLTACLLGVGFHGIAHYALGHLAAETGQGSNHEINRYWNEVDACAFAVDKLESFDIRTDTLIKFQQDHLRKFKSCIK